MNKSTLGIIIVCIIVAAGGVYMFSRDKQAGTQKTPGEMSNEESLQNGGNFSDLTSGEAVTPQISEIALTVTSPLNGSSVTTSKVTVKGRTKPKADVYANETEGVADGSGNFSLLVSLDDGDNSIIVTAIDGDGNVSETELIVTYNAGE